MEEVRDTPLTLRPWAKINLYLKVLGRRSDGYHEIITLIHPIALFDELTIRHIREGLTLNCRLEGLPINQNILPEQDNLVTRAVRLFFNRIGQRPSVEINMVKRIPIGGGLGGGSSDAANALSGLNQLFGEPLTGEALYNICLELGMDVPFFLEPRPALCKGRGEVIEKRYDGIRFWCVLVNPGKGLSTQSVYNSLILTGAKTGDNISRFAPLERAGFKAPPFLTGFAKINNINRIAEYVYNDLENSAVKLCPEIGDIIGLLKKGGAIRSFVCGSGSTVCGLVKNKKEAEGVMKKVRREVSGKWWIRSVSSLFR